MSDECGKYVIEDVLQNNHQQRNYCQFQILVHSFLPAKYIMRVLKALKLIRSDLFQYSRRCLCTDTDDIVFLDVNAGIDCGRSFPVQCQIVIIQTDDCIA